MEQKIEELIEKKYITLNNHLIVTSFNQGRLLGKGGFGEVRTYLSNKAIKKVDPYKGFNEFLAVEVLFELKESATKLKLDQSVLKKMFDRLLKIDSVVLISKDTQGAKKGRKKYQDLYIIMEKYEQDLEDSSKFVGNVDIFHRIRIYKEFLELLWFLRKLKLVHMDIKPQNMMLNKDPKTTPDDELLIKLIDFGLVVRNK